MPVGDDKVAPPKKGYALYPPHTYATIQEGLCKALTEKQVGRNGWSVMVALCRKLYVNGTFARMSAKNIAEFTGLTLYQVARGMAELRKKKIIAPVNRRTLEGYYKMDRPSYNHVAQYCVCREVWGKVVLLEKEAEKLPAEAAENGSAYRHAVNGLEGVRALTELQDNAVV